MWLAGMVWVRIECIHEVAYEGWVAGDRGGRVVRWLRVGLLDAGAGGHGDDGAEPGQDRQEVAAYPVGRVVPAGIPAAVRSCSGPAIHQRCP